MRRIVALQNLKDPACGPVAAGRVERLEHRSTETDQIGSTRLDGFDQGAALARTSFDEALEKLLRSGSGGGC